MHVKIYRSATSFWAYDFCTPQFFSRVFRAEMYLILYNLLECNWNDITKYISKKSNCRCNNETIAIVKKFAPDILIGLFIQSFERFCFDYDFIYLPEQ